MCFNGCTVQVKVKFPLRMNSLSTLCKVITEGRHFRALSPSPSVINMSIALVVVAVNINNYYKNTCGRHR